MINQTRSLTITLHRFLPTLLYDTTRPSPQLKPIFWWHLSNGEVNRLLPIARLWWRFEQVLATPKCPVQWIREGGDSRLVDCTVCIWLWSALLTWSGRWVTQQDQRSAISSTFRMLLWGTGWCLHCTVSAFYGFQTKEGCLWWGEMIVCHYNPTRRRKNLSCVMEAPARCSKTRLSWRHQQWPESDSDWCKQLGTDIYHPVWRRMLHTGIETIEVARLTLLPTSVGPEIWPSRDFKQSDQD